MVMPALMVPDALSTPDALTERPVPVKSEMESLLIRIFPPVMVSPCDDENPAAVMPPVNEDVAVFVLRSDPPVMVSPFDENNPPCPKRTVPLEKVLVAVFCWKSDPPVMVSPLPESNPPAALNPPAKVEVPVVDCRSIWPALITVDVASPVPVKINLPATASWDPGLVVPIPTLPCESMMRAVATTPAGVVVETKNTGAVEVPVNARVAEGDEVPSPKFPDGRRIRRVEVAPGLGPVVEAMVKSGLLFASPNAPAIERRAQGEEVPMPRKPFVVSRLRKFAESRVVAPE